jgi:hypothetical protein
LTHAAAKHFRERVTSSAKVVAMVQRTRLHFKTIWLRSFLRGLLRYEII